VGTVPIIMTVGFVGPDIFVISPHHVAGDENREYWYFSGVKSVNS
jgi:hypothetical protein